MTDTSHYPCAGCGCELGLVSIVIDGEVYCADRCSCAARTSGHQQMSALAIRPFAQKALPICKAIIRRALRRVDEKTTIAASHIWREGQTHQVRIDLANGQRIGLAIHFYVDDTDFVKKLAQRILDQVVEAESEAA